MYLSCPECGDLRIKLGSIFGLEVIRSGSEEDDLSDYKEESASLLLTPKRHPLLFIVLYLPVVASIIVATIIHEFTVFYLLIPGVWCYGVGCFIIEGIYKGSMSDNHGTALRSKSPVRFWGKIGIWFLFYVFATAFPIGFAMQEHSKADTEQFCSSNSQGRAALADGCKIEGVSFLLKSEKACLSLTEDVMHKNEVI